MDTILSSSDSSRTPEEEQVDVFPTQEPSPFDQTLQQQHQFYISEANRMQRDHPERYSGHSLAQRILDMDSSSSSESRSNGVMATADSTVSEMPPPRFSLSQQSTQAHASTNPSSEQGSELPDYHQIWMNSNIATAVLHIENGQILRGNNRFMKYCVLWKGVMK